MSKSQPSLQPSSIPSKDVQVPSWKRYLNKAMREPDAAKLAPLVYACEEALILRWPELGADDIHHEEREAMKAAANDLWMIKIHKLGWPGF
jgi:hypothetical protein